MIRLESDDVLVSVDTLGMKTPFVFGNEIFVKIFNDLDLGEMSTQFASDEAGKQIACFNLSDSRVQHIGGEQKVRPLDVGTKLVVG